LPEPESPTEQAPSEEELARLYNDELSEEELMAKLQAEEDEEDAEWSASTPSRDEEPEVPAEPAPSTASDESHAQVEIEENEPHV